jgi:plastocyanin
VPHHNGLQEDIQSPALLYISRPFPEPVRDLGSNPQGSISTRSPETAIPLLSSIVVAILFGVLALSIGSAFFLIFTVLFAATAALVWRRSRVGWTIGIVLSILVLLLFSANVQADLTGFADLTSFGIAIMAVPALILNIAYSAFGMVGSMRKGVAGKQRMLPAASTLALLTVGFVLGSLFVGVLANGAVLSIGQAANTSANVTIVVGAANGGVAAPFSPATYTTKAGSTITWVNKDTIAHTVVSTSVPSGASSFSSGNIQYGNTYSVTLTVPGTYKYECSIHPSMIGTLIVTS